MEEQSPTVSIIIPTYNRGDVIERSVRSVLEQTYTDFEVIVVDDGSTDHTEEVIQGLDDSRITYIEHERNRGAAAARNTGIEAANGEFIAFQDSDDEWKAYKLEMQMDIFEQAPPEVGVVYTAFLQFTDDGKQRVPNSNLSRTEGDLQQPLLDFNFITTQVAVVRRDCFRKVGLFDDSLPRLIDWDLWIRISEHYEFKFIDEPLVNVYRQPDSISEDETAAVVARKRILEKHRSKFDTRALANQQYWVGHGLLKVGEANEGRYLLFKAVTSDPRLSYLASFLISIFGSGVYNTIYELVTNFRNNSFD